MPKEKSKTKIEFKRHNRMIKVPFVVFTDFEAIVKRPINSIEPNIENSIKSLCPVDFLTKSFTLTIRFGLKILCYTERRIRRNLKKGKTVGSPGSH